MRAQRSNENHDFRPLQHGRLSRICVAVDASNAADAAARLAISLVRRNYHAALDFCHVINVPRMVAHVDRTLDNYGVSFELAQEAARIVLARCKLLAQQADVSARTSIRFGNPSSETLSFAQGLGADLIVIGNKPTNKIHRLLNGSVRDLMARTSTLPILVVPASVPRTIDFRPTSILVPEADLPAANRAKRFAADLAADYVSRVILLPATHEGTDEEKRNVERAIGEYRPGLIVATCTHNRLRNVFAEDIIERLLQEAEVPLLVVAADELSEFRSR